MKWSKVSSMMLIGSLVFGIVASIHPAKASAAIGSSDFLKTSGKTIKNNNGNGSVINLRGTNLGGWLLRENWMSPLGEAAINRSGWIASASSNGDSPQNALDGSPNTRWTTGTAQTAGQWFEVDMQSPQSFDRITIDAGPSTGDYPAGFQVQVSNDNQNWTTAASGSGGGQLTDIAFSAQTARYIKINQTGSKGNWWSIAELNVYVADEWSVRQTLNNRFGTPTADSIVSGYQNTWIQSSDLDNIQNMGLNFVRVPIYWEILMNRDGSMKSDSDSFGKLDWLVSQCQQRGIYVLLDLHGVPGNDDGWQSGGRTGANELWTNTAYQNWTTQIWQRLAGHYAGNPTVAGYDLLNEPVSNSSNLSISQFYNTLYQAVRAVDPDHMIYVEAFPYWNSIVSPSAYGWTNVVYELHNYDWNSSDYNSQSSSINAWFNDIIWHQNNWNVPVYSGEFTLFSFNDLWEKWLSGLDALGVSWTNWTYKVTSGGNWGLYQNNTNPFPDVNNDSSGTISSKLSQFGTSSFQANTSLINIVKAYSRLPGASSIMAKANNNYVSADNAGGSPLIANRTAVGTWEKFIIVTNADGTVSFLSMANNKYVTADINQGGKLIAEAQGINSWEKFTKVTNADGTVSFQAKANNQYVSTDLNAGSPTLIADRSSIGGSWEAYTIASAP